MSSDWTTYNVDKANGFIGYLYRSLWNLDKYPSYSKMMVFETLDFQALLEMMTGYYEASFLSFANVLGAGTLHVLKSYVTVKCPSWGDACGWN